MAVCAGAAWEIWPTAAAFVFSTIRTVHSPPSSTPPPFPPLVSQGKQRHFRPGSMLRFQPTDRAPLLPRLGLTAAGQSQRLFAEACFDVTTDS